MSKNGLKNRKFNISVCMATYNGEKYIKEQLVSILKQLNPEDELVISDDNSIDGTIDIVNDFMKNNKNIKLVMGPKTGYSNNFENAVNNSRNEIIFFSDQDDVWSDNKIDLVCKVFAENSDCTTVLHNMDVFSSESVSIDKPIKILYHKGVLSNFIKSCYWGCCMAIKRDFLVKFFPFKEYAVGHDQLIGLLTEKYGKCVFVSENLIRHRIHSSNTSHSKTIKEMIDFRVKLYKDYKASQKIFKKNR